MSEILDIGQQLQAARKKMELELADVQHRQRIPVRILGALEKSDYSVFSSPAYARSYLKQYSEFLRVDVGDWLDSFDVSGTLANLDNYEYLNIDSEDQPLSASRRSKRKRLSSEADSAGAMVPVLITLITAAFVGLGFYGYQLLDKTQSQNEVAAVEPVEDTEVQPLGGGAPERSESSPQVSEAVDTDSEVEGTDLIVIDPPQEVPRAVIVPE